MNNSIRNLSCAVVVSLGAVMFSSVSYAGGPNDPANKNPTGATGLAVGTGGQVEAANRLTATAVTVCYTCGGDWPILVGIVRPGTGLGSYASYERGSSCGGALNWSSDTSPYLCAR